MNLTINSPSLDNDVHCPNHSISNQALSYFDLISQKLDLWEAKKLLQKEKSYNLRKSFLLKDHDDINGVVKTFRITTELIATEQVDALELPEPNIGRESEVSYVS